MAAFILRRLGQTLPVLLGILLICFGLLKASGDPTLLLAGERSTEEDRAAIRKKWHLDEPWFLQLKFFATGMVTGELRSFRNERPVIEEILRGAEVTGRLALGAIVVALSLGLLAGLLSAYRPRSWMDYSAAALATLGVSVPAFWLAMLLTLVFSVRLGWLPIGGYEPGRLEYLVIPVATLGLVTMALISRLSRHCLLEASTQDYARTARAKGLSAAATLIGHVLPNAMIPIVTVTGNQLASLMTGAVLTETACAVPGLGRLVFQAIGDRDYPMILGCCLFFALVFVLVNLAVDIVYGLLDPRIRHA